MKLVPGMNKRGKGEVVLYVCGHGDSDVCVSLAAARAALHRFIQSRDSSQRERDLLKSVSKCVLLCVFCEDHMNIVELLYACAFLPLFCACV